MPPPSVWPAPVNLRQGTQVDRVDRPPLAPDENTAAVQIEVENPQSVDPDGRTSPLGNTQARKCAKDLLTVRRFDLNLTGEFIGEVELPEPP
jgi:hypothetical protein